MKTPIGYRHDGLTIRKTRRKGRGVFTLRAFKKDEIIEVAPTLLLSEGDGDVLWTTKLKDYLFGVHTFGREGLVLALGFGSFYNHSFDPNAAFAVGTKTVVIKALRPIKQNEEVVVDYGWTSIDYEEVGIKVPDDFVDEENQE